MDNGMWVLGLAVLPLICLIVALFLIFTLRKQQKQQQNQQQKRQKDKFTIVLIIILLFPILSIVSHGIEKNFEKSKYVNVKNLKYEIKQVSNWEFDIYFYDNDGYYYWAKRHGFNEQYEIEAYLIKTGKEKRLGLNIDLRTISRTSKIYMKDYHGNKILVWNYEDYQ